MCARGQNRPDFIGWNNNTLRGRVSMTEYAWNNNGRGMETFRGGPHTSMFTSRYTYNIYIAYLYMRVSGPKENTSEWVVLFLRHSRDVRRSYKHMTYIYIYIYIDSRTT